MTLSRVLSGTTILVAAAGGTFLDGSGSHGFLEDKHGRFTTIDFPGTSSGTQVFGINNAGDFVGSFGGHGFVDPPGDAVSTVPEPSALLLLGSGIAGLAGMRWRLA